MDKQGTTMEDQRMTNNQRTMENQRGDKAAAIRKSKVVGRAKRRVADSLFLWYVYFSLCNCFCPSLTQNCISFSPLSAILYVYFPPLELATYMSYILVLRQMIINFITVYVQT